MRAGFPAHGSQDGRGHPIYWWAGIEVPAGSVYNPKVYLTFTGRSPVFIVAVGHAPAPSQHPFGSVMDLSSRLCFPAAFRLLAFASWDISSPPPSWASLAVGLLIEPDDDGVITFRTSEKRAGWVPSLLRGRGVLPSCVLDSLALTRHRRLGQPSVRRLVNHGASSKVHLHSPVRTFPGPVCPDGSDAPWPSPLASHPTVASDARRGWEPALDTCRGRCDHSTGATSCRTRTFTVYSGV